MQVASFRITPADNERQSPVQFKSFTADSYKSVKQRKQRKVRNPVGTLDSSRLVRNKHGGSQIGSANGPVICTKSRLGNAGSELESSVAELSPANDDLNSELAEPLRLQIEPLDLAPPGLPGPKSPMPNTKSMYAAP